VKAYNRLLAAVIVLMVLIFAGVNLWLVQEKDIEGRQYRVEAARAASEIENDGIESVDLSDYPTLAAIERVDIDSREGLTGGNYDYLIKEINGGYYRFDYTAPTEADGRITAAVNIVIGAMAAVMLFVMLYMRQRIIKPFFVLRDMPYELSKGNLTLPLKEKRQRFFGRFVWGMDMLREKLEENKRNEMSLQAERKKLILSLSHDIKIPLSAIKLYSKALSKGLYDSAERQNEIAERINEKADEIEHYVTGIVTASREDFLALEVNEGEFYLSEVMDKISEYYTDRLKLLKIDFFIKEYRNCLVRGDLDRAVEVIENIIENAIKYGDGRNITVEFSDDDGCRLVTVENTGCTLPQSELPHMFDSFWRGSNSSDSSGSGLGLYICRGLMNKMGGEVFAEIKDGKMRVTAVFVPA